MNGDVEIVKFLIRTENGNPALIALDGVGREYRISYHHALGGQTSVDVQPLSNRPSHVPPSGERVTAAGLNAAERLIESGLCRRIKQHHESENSQHHHWRFFVIQYAPRRLNLSGHGSNKSQADDLAIVIKAGWKEDHSTVLQWRWYHPSDRPRVYRTLRDAAELIRIHQRAMTPAEVLSMKDNRPSPAYFKK